jgi:uncharacterized protein YndB with AHSA1/START domain
VIIDRPIEEVFAYIANGENNAHWRGGILEVERTSDHGGLNATYHQVISGPNGRRVKHDYRVTSYEPPTLVEFKHMVGLARPSGRFELAALGPERTKVTFEMGWQPKGIQRVVDNMIGTWMSGEVARLDELKRILEKG